MLDLTSFLKRPQDVDAMAARATPVDSRVRFASSAGRTARVSRDRHSRCRTSSHAAAAPWRDCAVRPHHRSAHAAVEKLERWLQARIDRHPAATSLPMLDGYAAAIVAGPVSMSPLDWICPLLAIDADAFNHGDRGVRGDLRRRAAPQR